MSYDVYLHGPKCEKCGRQDTEYGPDPTYNLTPIFDRALTGEELPNPGVGEIDVVLFGEETDRPRGLRLLSGKRAGDTKAVLDAAIDRLSDHKNADTFAKLAPENGWGTVEGALTVLNKLLGLARTYPDHTWEIR